MDYKVCCSFSLSFSCDIHITTVRETRVECLNEGLEGWEQGICLLCVPQQMKGREEMATERERRENIHICNNNNKNLKFPEHSNATTTMWPSCP